MHRLPLQGRSCPQCEASVLQAMCLCELYKTRVLWWSDPTISRESIRNFVFAVWFQNLSRDTFTRLRWNMQNVSNFPPACKYVDYFCGFFSSGLCTDGQQDCCKIPWQDSPRHGHVKVCPQIWQPARREFSVSDLYPNLCFKGLVLHFNLCVRVVAEEKMLDMLLLDEQLKTSVQHQHWLSGNLPDHRSCLS